MRDRSLIGQSNLTYPLTRRAQRINYMSSLSQYIVYVNKKFQHLVFLSSERKELAGYLKNLDGETRVVMEHTGWYYEPVARFLHEKGIFVSAVNPKLIKDL